MTSQVNPSIYWKYVGAENGQELLYVHLKRILKDIESHGFELKIYDPCVVNKTVNGKQMMIFYQVDYLNILYVDKKIVTRIIKWMKSVYE